MRSPAFALILTTTALALAEEKPTARLSWVRLPGAESCVDDASLRKSVTARLGRDPFVAAPTLAVEGTIAREPKRWIAKLWIRDADGKSLGERELTSEADTCASLGEAVSLALVLAIDPDAAASHSPSPSPSPTPTPKPTPKPIPTPTPTPTRLNADTLEFAWSACAVAAPGTALRNTKPRGRSDDHLGIRCCAR